MVQSFRFDPRDLIGPPWWKCPNCGSDRYGVLSIGGNSYSRRCQACRHTERYELPEITKRIVYLDQFAISNMMKALNPRAKAHGKMAVAGPWRPLFERLDRLSKSQVLVSPASMFHIDESVVSPFPEALKRMYDQLSHGTTLAHPSEIKMRQVHAQVDGWLHGQPRSHDFSPASVCRDLDEWQDRLIISVNLFDDPDRVRSLRAHRSSLNHALSEVAEQWRGIARTFKEAFEAESKAWGEAIVMKYRSYLERVQNDPSTMGEIPEGAGMFLDIAAQLRDSGVSGEETTKMTIEFLSSSSSAEIPFVRISALLYAALARKFHEGRKKLPIVLIDNECYTYLNEEPLRSHLGHETRLFCKNTIKDFLAYLDDMWRAIPQAHLAKIREVYGEDWLRPYVGLYDREPEGKPS